MILFNALKILKYSSFWPVMYFWDCPEVLENSQWILEKTKVNAQGTEYTGHPLWHT